MGLLLAVIRSFGQGGQFVKPVETAPLAATFVVLNVSLVIAIDSGRQIANILTEISSYFGRMAI